MQLKNRIIGCIVMLAMLVLCTSAYGQTFRDWVGGATGNWGTASNWSGNNVPNTSGEIARFDNEVVSVTLDASFTIGELHVINGASVLISASTARTLTLDADSGTDGKLIVDSGGAQGSDLNIGALTTLRYLDADEASEIGGTLILSTATSRLRAQDNVIMGPEDPGTMNEVYGFLEGHHNDAEIEIVRPVSGTRTYQNSITTIGALTIMPEGREDGTARFLNKPTSSDPDSGVVQASELVSNQNTLVLAEDLEVRDEIFRTNVLPLWAAVDDNAVLQFDTEAFEDPFGDAVLFGDFLLDGDDAVLMFNESVATQGGFNQVEGSVMVASGEEFCWDNFLNCIQGM